MRQLDRIKRELEKLAGSEPAGVEARILAGRLGLDRSTASRYLNELVRLGQARKVPGRPVRYLPASDSESVGIPRFPIDETLTGTDRMLLEEALAALLYPPHGLPILLTGETGSGKSWLAQKMAEIAAASGRLPKDAPFVPFNCAEYAHNPELLLAQLFGVKKGAFTGADTDRPGLVEQAAGGVLFLDEVHRLPPTGQEMLFHLIDRGTYRRLGETGTEHRAALRLVAATTESPETALITTLRRRFSTVLTVPPLRERPLKERKQLLEMVLREEERKMGLPLMMDETCRIRFLRYDCPGNIGQLKSDLRIACARAFLRSLKEGTGRVEVRPEDLPAHVSQAGAVTAAAREALPRQDGEFSADPGEPAGFYDQLVRRRAELLNAGTDELMVTRELERMADNYIRQLLASRSSEPGPGIPADSPLIRALE
jgi:transcriptional regulator with AAA-type ATPase domain